MGFAIHSPVFPDGEPMADGTPEFKKCLVFPVTSFMVAGKHSIKTEDQGDIGQKVENRPPKQLP